MFTLQELKQVVSNREERRKVPSAKYLRENEVAVAKQRLMDCAEIIAYQTGYVLYCVGDYATVFPLFTCRDYVYEAERKIAVVEENFFDDQPWYVRLILEGEDRLWRNRETREHNNCVSYSCISEEWCELADTMLFLGGKESTTLKEISETLGKETIDLYNTSDTRGQSRSYGLNYQKTGKELMSRDELAVMDGNKCILQLRGVRPFYSDKFDITKHKRYKQLSDYDKKNEFHVEEYMKHQMEVRLNPEEAFDLYVYEGSELEKQSNSENEGTEHVT